MVKQEALIRQLSKYISPKRVAHSLRVADSAVALAKQHHANSDACLIAGTLHDIAKRQTPSELEQFGISNTEPDVWETHPAIWHALVGPAMIQALFQINDARVDEAVRYHTTGYHSLNTEAKIIFVADFIEPQRDHPGRELVASMAMANLDQAVAAVALYSIQRLTKKNVDIHPYTSGCWNAFSDQLTKKQTDQLMEIIAQ